MKLLIADSSLMSCRQYAQALSECFDINICNDGVTAAQTICQLRPDIVIMDIMLPGKDGIAVLQECSRAGVKPLVLATSYIVNRYVQEHLEILDVEYLMRKPCDLAAVVSCVGDLRRQLLSGEEKPDRDDGVCRLLMSLNFSPKHCGYRCLHTALLTLQKDPTQSLTKELYPAVAAIHGGSSQRVERAMRIAIHKAWEKRDENVWKLYFPSGRSGNVPCPTNGEFLSGLCCCLQAFREKAI